MEPRWAGHCRVVVALFVIALVGVGARPADAQSPRATLDLAHAYPSLVIPATDDGLTLPPAIPSGRYLVTL